MYLYNLTVFEESGEKLYDNSFEALTDKQAKDYGLRILKEKKWIYKTHRCTSPSGNLLLFNR